jgi:DNA-binding CsgD family transcriptional regulator
LIDAAGLTEREREVLELVLLGRSHQDIATALGISERTSKFHHANLLAKLGAESRIDLLRLFS